MSIEEMEPSPWYKARFTVMYGDAVDYYSVSIDIELIEDGFIIGTDSNLKYVAIPISSIIHMEQEGDKD